MFSFGFGLQHNTIYLQRALAMLSQLKEYKFWGVYGKVHTHTHTYRHTEPLHTQTHMHAIPTGESILEHVIQLFIYLFTYLFMFYFYRSSLNLQQGLGRDGTYQEEVDCELKGISQPFIII